MGERRESVVFNSTPFVESMIQTGSGKQTPIPGFPASLVLRPCHFYPIWMKKLKQDVSPLWCESEKIEAAGDVSTLNG